MTRAFRYSRWDGTQAVPELDAEALLDEITDDLLYHGDLHAAMRRLMQQGMTGADGERLQGLREMLERLRQRRQEELDRYDLGGVYEDVARRLDEVVEMERQGIQRRRDEARAEGDPRRQEIVEGLAGERSRQLDAMPPDLAGRVSELQQYDFMDDEARQRFEELLDELRQEMLRSTFNQMSDALSNMTPEQMQRMKDMLAELNQMLEQRAAGQEPDFDRFMERYGDFFPGNPRNLDELLEQMARSMAQMQSLMASMTPEQRQQLQQLANSLLDDIDLQWQVDELSRHLQDAFPDLPWNRRMQFSGQDPLDLARAASLMDTLDDLDALERMLQQATQPGALAEVDVERAAELLGEDAGRSLERLAELARMLEEAGLIEQREGRYELTPRGMRRIGQKALGDLFEHLAKDRIGRHETVRSGAGNESDYETKPYEFGDPFRLDVQGTVRNALRRAGPGTPVRLSPDDFEVERTELLTRAATVLMVDLSLSMPMRDNFLAAKKVAMALHALISSRFPRDYLGIVGFSEVARELRPQDIPEVSWDFVYGTNMQHGFLLARRMLARQSGTKQIIMVTDGEPTAHIENGEPFFAYPPVPRTIEETLKEVMRCTKEGIRINTFMLDASYHLKEFVERMTRMNRGRAFFTTPETLGDYVLVDFLEQRRTRRTAV
ncbi:MAG TPA: hypothetical protein VM618_12905 [Acidimicrobiia bacterium]|nr:hypothetical protein [Acidimicrobiia bacterium]